MLVGGAGRDRLTGGFEGDVFRFDALTDSYRTATVAHTDLLVDFTSYDGRLDLTALGISGFGDGHHGTLKAYYNATQNVTYLKNFDADDQGRRFELQLSGDQSRLSNPAVFIEAICLPAYSKLEKLIWLMASVGVAGRWAMGYFSTGCRACADLIGESLSGSSNTAA